MAQIIYTQDAVADLHRLREFIADNPPPAAQRIAQELLRRIRQLQHMPMMGRPVAAAPDPDIIRDMVFGNYTVRYAIHGQMLTILRIWHHLENRT